jgi:hypothetical protein
MFVDGHTYLLMVTARVPVVTHIWGMGKPQTTPEFQVCGRSRADGD